MLSMILLVGIVSAAMPDDLKPLLKELGYPESTPGYDKWWADQPPEIIQEITSLPADQRWAKAREILQRQIAEKNAASATPAATPIPTTSTPTGPYSSGVLKHPSDPNWEFKYENSKWYSRRAGSSTWSDMKADLTQANYDTAIGRLKNRHPEVFRQIASQSSVTSTPTGPYNSGVLTISGDPWQFKYENGKWYSRRGASGTWSDMKADLSQANYDTALSRIQKQHPDVFTKIAAQSSVAATVQVQPPKILRKPGDTWWEYMFKDGKWITRCVDNKPNDKCKLTDWQEVKSVEAIKLLQQEFPDVQKTEMPYGQRRIFEEISGILDLVNRFINLRITFDTQEYGYENLQERSANSQVATKSLYDEARGFKLLAQQKRDYEGIRIMERIKAREITHMYVILDNVKKTLTIRLYDLNVLTDFVGLEYAGTHQTMLEKNFKEKLPDKLDPLFDYERPEPYKEVVLDLEDDIYASFGFAQEAQQKDFAFNLDKLKLVFYESDIQTVFETYAPSVTQVNFIENLETNTVESPNVKGLANLPFDLLYVDSSELLLAKWRIFGNSPNPNSFDPKLNFALVVAGTVYDIPKDKLIKGQISETEIYTKTGKGTGYYEQTYLLPVLTKQFPQFNLKDARLIAYTDQKPTLTGGTCQNCAMAKPTAIAHLSSTSPIVKLYEKASRDIGNLPTLWESKSVYTIGEGISIDADLKKVIAENNLNIEDVEYLTRVVAVENPSASLEERGGIMRVAYNRANEGKGTFTGNTIKDIVSICNSKKDSWNCGSKYMAKITNSNYGMSQNKKIAVSAVNFLLGQGREAQGAINIGCRDHFVHRKTQLALGRKIPAWNKVNPLLVGIATFSGPVSGCKVYPPKRSSTPTVASSATGSSILYIGDSHTAGDYGKEMDRLLKTKSSNVYTYGCVSANAQDFIAGTRTCDRGSTFQNQVKDYTLPKIDDLLTTHNPNIVIVSLGSNHLGYPKTSKEIIDKLQGKTCYWIGPPVGPNNPSPGKPGKTPAQLEAFYNGLNAVKGHCTVLDSRPPTSSFNFQAASATEFAKNNPHIHHYGAPGKAACKAWAKNLFDKMSLPTAVASVMGAGAPPAGELEANMKCKTTQGDDCVFPFVYKGETYIKCTTVDGQGKEWCATRPEYDAAHWGWCVCEKVETESQPTADEQSDSGPDLSLGDEEPDEVGEPDSASPQSSASTKQITCIKLTRQLEELDRDLDYSDSSKFKQIVKELNLKDIITDSELNDIKGVGVFNTEEDVAWVLNLIGRGSRCAEL